MSGRRRIVRVPASSANLGPGYDVLGAALELELELEVVESGEFTFDPGGLDLPLGRENLLVRSFERLHPADDISFKLRSEIPLARGLGSSASAILAGLLAADHLYELGNSRELIFAHACEIEGHPDNVAAALFGGFTVTAPPGAPQRGTPADPIVLGDTALPATSPSLPAFIDPPEGLEAILVIPDGEVSTRAARAALPPELPVAEVVHNLSAVANLVLGIERSDLTLIERGLADRMHQERRAHLFPRSFDVIERARDLGAIGATISGAGPTVLVWSFWQAGARVLAGLEELCAGWGTVRRVPFSPRGARVELPD
ncbi:MAG: homoserine kinase [Solirubrobacterales bacterium]|nr:homoserine kinase [Solirubrobacterales bacterium]